MKISIRNLSNKKRSRKAMNELKDFAREIAQKLKITDNISEIRLRYTKQFNGYYPKGQPLGGFFKLYNPETQVVTIDFTGFWDISREDRLVAIVHELTHVHQMVSEKLQISSDGKECKWKGKDYQKWKKLKLSLLDDMTPDEQTEYLHKYLPWEKEVDRNCKKYIKK